MPPETSSIRSGRLAAAVGGLRNVGLVTVLLGATWYFGSFVDAHYPIEDWLFWIFAQAWLLTLVFALSCLSTGFVLTRWLLGKRLKSVELLTLSMPMGVFAFFLAMFVLGLFGWYGPVTFALLPLSMIATGARPLFQFFRRLMRRRLAWRRRNPPSPWMYVAWAFGLVVLGMAYFLILSPANISFDSRWKHLAIAEHYATQGFVGPFLEGWIPGTAPHLPSFFFAWAFLIRPWGDLFGQLALVAHMEFVLFLWTLIGIGALVRRLVPGVDPRWVWVVRFLFPGLLVYDSNLSVGTDHIAAIFAIPIFLMTMRVWRTMEVRDSIVLAVMISGGLLTKYSSAFSLFAFPVLAIAFRSLTLALRGTKRSPFPDRPLAWLLVPAACLVGGLVFSSPHWLKNWVWYGSPVYPAGGDFFTLRPWTPEATEVFRYGYLGQMWRPSADWEGFLSSLKVLLTFSFIPHNYSNFHGKLPVFGSLLTLALLCLPFLRATRWLWALFASIHVGIFTWFWVHHQDRHLQTLMPLMAAATAAVLALLWRQGKATRAALLLAIALQVVWGGDAWFFPTHAMAKTPIVASAELLGSGFTKKPEQRLRTFAGINAVRNALPKGAKLLLHDISPHTGIGVPSVTDTKGWQGGISYGQLATPGAIFDKYRELGITHILWTDESRGWDSLAADVAFWNFVQRHARDKRRVGGFHLAKMPDERPDDSPPGEVLVAGCGKGYRSGLYPFEALTIPAFGEKPPEWPAPAPAAQGAQAQREALRGASFAFVEKRCPPHPELRTDLSKEFEQVATRRRKGRYTHARYPTDHWEIWRRIREPAPLPNP